MQGIEQALNHVILRNLVVSILAVIVLLVLRRVVIRTVLKKELPVEVRRRLLVNSRNAVLLFVLLAFVFIWAQELRTLALSAVAIAAAIVIATKELILCLSGSLYRASAGAFAVGDRVEIGNYRGDVIDQTLLSTTLLEIGPGQSSHQHTGRAIVIPNGMLLTAAVVNETFTQEFVLHLFPVPVKGDEDWKEAEKQLLDAANAECLPYLEDAKRHFAKMQRRFSLESTQIEPRISVFQPDPGRINLLVRIPVPARQKGRVEQAILRRYLQTGQYAREVSAPTGDPGL